MKGKIFNAQEVQAIIAGTKTMFREVIKTQTKTNEPLNLAYTTPYRTWEWGNSGVYVEEPYEVGQKVFVKEAFALRNKEGKFFQFSPFIAYETDGELSRWAMRKPAQYMKQEHSRLTLEITDIKVESLADISNADCRSEGEDQWSFICNWNATHKKPEEKFEVNPFVWVVDFKINK